MDLIAVLNTRKGFYCETLHGIRIVMDVFHLRDYNWGQLPAILVPLSRGTVSQFLVTADAGTQSVL